MILFINFLRALAACLITNSHYTGIYPTDLIANGGIIGDVLFFAVSGYCLYNIKYDLSPLGFLRWYGKRLWRIYPPVVIVTAVFLIAKIYSMAGRGFIGWFVYPTNYHFIASIIILYVPFFFIMKIDALRRNLLPIMAFIAAAWLAVYFTVYDRSRYHIDSVYEPMIRFLFMQSMLLGAWFRQKDGAFRNRFKPLYPILAVALFGVYFALKLMLTKRASLAPLQFLNQIAVFALLFFIFRTFCGLDSKLEKLPDRLKRAVVFISDMTLEIYVVQYVLIAAIRKLGLFFPLNWVLLTAAIIIAAFVLHKLCEWMYSAADGLLERRKKA